MTHKTKKGNETLYAWDICGFAYKKKSLAQKCEDFCNENHQCSLEITMNAVPSGK